MLILRDSLLNIHLIVAPSTDCEDNCPYIGNSQQTDSDNDKIGDACDNDVCFDAENFGVNATCVDNCCDNCQQVCEYFGIPYVSRIQCSNAGSEMNAEGDVVLGNKKCEVNHPENLPKKGICCKCVKSKKWWRLQLLFKRKQPCRH